jgi:hypothetical protein
LLENKAQNSVIKILGQIDAFFFFSARNGFWDKNIFVKFEMDFWPEMAFWARNSFSDKNTFVKFEMGFWPEMAF